MNQSDNEKDLINDNIEAADSSENNAEKQADPQPEQSKQPEQTEQPEQPNQQEQPKKTKKKKLPNGRRKAIMLEIQIVALFLVVCFALGAIAPLRPTFSEEEKRELTKFPVPTFASIMDGSFFSQLELWYSDTFPFRQTWIDVNSWFSSLFGKRGEQVIGSLPVSGDSIPTVNTDHDWFDPPIPTGDTTTTKNPSTTTGKPDTGGTTGGSPSTSEKPVTQPPQTDAPKPPDTGGTPQDPSVINSVYVFGDTAYELYGFNQKSSDRYVNLINALADRMSGKATVYPIVAPLAYGIKLDEATIKKYKLTDEQQALMYMYSRMNDNVKKVYTYNNLLRHKDEYLFFRTDHHWTALGAYYAYEMFCAHKGIAPIPLSSYTEKQFPGFLGTLYATCKNPPALKANPDTVYAYVPNGVTKMKFWDKKSADPTTWNIIQNVSNWNAASKYNTFIGGDNPYSEIHNTSKSDGSACVVVKNSFGNAYVPFLVDHYEYVYVVDFRYYDEWSAKYNGGKTFAQLVDEKNISDILVVTNIIATGSSGMLTSMEKLFTK